MPGRRAIALLVLAGALAAPAGAAAPARTLTLTPRPQYVTRPVRIAGKHWPRCGMVRLSVKPRNAKPIAVAKARIRPDGSFARAWTPSWRLGGQLVRVTAATTCGKKAPIVSSSTMRILATP